MTLMVKLGTLLVIFFIPTRFAIDFQLLGGVWMIQCFPAVVFGLFTRRFTGPALLAGWATGMVLGTYLSWGTDKWMPTHPVFDLFVAYNGLTAVCANIIVSALLSLLLRSPAPDETIPADYKGETTALA